MHWSSPAGSSGFRVLALASLDVLHLLAELLHLRLLAEHQVRDLAVTRLGAGGIELALELLEQELDPLADRAALAERRGERAQVRFEAYQLLGHVAPLGEHGDLLGHPAAIELGAAHQAHQALLDLAAQRGQGARQPAADGCRRALERGDAGEHVAPEVGALAPALALERAQRARTRSRTSRSQGAYSRGAMIFTSRKR